MEARFTAAVRIAATMLALLVVSMPARAGAQSVLREGFERPELLWSDAGGNASYSLARHEHVGTGAHTGTGCEFVEVAASNGSYVYLRYPLGQARIIAELEPAVWLRSDRPGL